MASTPTTWSPTSLQLRFALISKTHSPNSLPYRFNNLHLHRPLQLGYASGRRNGGERMRSDFAVGAFSGWAGSESNEDEQSVEFQRKKWFGGIVGAGLAGVVLFAGLTFAALSLSKRSSSSVKPQMEPMTSEQEVSLASDTKDDQVEDGGETADSNIERETGTSKDVSSSSDYNYVSSENKIGSDSEGLPVGDVVSSGSSAFIQHDFAENEVVGSVPIASSVNDSEASVETGFPEPITEVIQENLDKAEPVNLSSATDLGSDTTLDSSSSSSVHAPVETVAVIVSVDSESILEPQISIQDDSETKASPITNKNLESAEKPQVLGERNSSVPEVYNLDGSESAEATSLSEPTNPLSYEKETYDSLSEPANPLSYEKETYDNTKSSVSRSFSEPTTPESSFAPAGIPAPSVVSAALQVQPGKVLVPAVIDPVQGQAIAALQVLKVIEADAQPGDLCTRREYARWLVSASSALSRNTMSKVYPAMYIENVTELAFDDIMPDDPDFSFIQGLAEAGLISSKLSNHDLLNEDTGPFNFSPESPLSRQDLVSWKMALEKRQLPEADRKILYQNSGFIDINKINPDAWPALVADLSAGEQGIISLAFGCTRLFQPNKPVTKAQAAIALATGEASDVVSEELTRIEAESAAENAVSAHNALVAEVEKDINESFEKELTMEREKNDAVEKLAEETRQELERLQAEREADKLSLMKERASIESEMEILAKLRRDVEEQLESFMSSKVEISYEKERINKLKEDAERENQEIARLQYELEVERKALSMARAWAEDEAKRAREQAKALEEARDRWERHGIKVVVDNDLREETAAKETWLNASKQYDEGTVNRAQGLADQLKIMAENVKGKSKEIINTIIQKIQHFISVLKELASKAGTRAGELKDVTIQKTKESVEGLQQSTAELSLAFKDGARRVAGDCREGVGKLTQRFKT